VRIVETAIPDVRIIEPDVFEDSRGIFFELWSGRRYADAGIDGTFVQDNVSVSTHGVVRGLHFQHPNAQGKLISVLDGELFDVAVDLRRGATTFGQWVGITLSAENHRQLWIPPGFAHGFAVTGPRAVCSYKATAYYDAVSEQTLMWNDPALGIEWPVASPIISAKDAQGRALADIPPASLPSQ
jgi:dTDP-4-dehydrorhamnose 3,5-epimerase